ncbi:helix-turn-helix domain-containing protein [Streptomyces erythrochromogenes]|uniref:helix-turn-helix domain-containing protein n=1 Tax=Streptomyces erythrochromogenes TaxID=285574 RepID=UPI0036C174B7
MPTAGKNSGVGRSWGPIRAANPQAHKLAVFLRTRVDESGKTLAALATAINMSRSQISVYLGGKVPTQRFVTAIVDATVPAPLRERRQEEANTLLRDAHSPRKPASGTTLPAVGVVELAQIQARQIDTYDRLTRSLEQQAELREAADNSAKLVMILLGMIHKLQNRVTGLTAERDQLAHAEHGTALEAAQRKLGRAEAQAERAREELARAEEKKRQAEELAARLQQRIDDLADDLDRLRGDGSSPHDHLPDLAAAASPRAPGPVSEDPEGDDFDAALARASAINDTDADTVHRITTQFADTVRGNGPNLPDNPSTSTDAPDNAYTEQELASRIVEAERIGNSGDPVTARDLYSEIVADYTRRFAFDHPSTLPARQHHTLWIGDAGNTATARDLDAALVADCTRVLGAEHPHTLVARHNHARWTGMAGDAATARDLGTVLIDDCTRIMGADHRYTLATRHNHAEWTGAAGDAATARALGTVLANDRARILGPYHPDTFATGRLITRWTDEVQSSDS